MTPVRLFFIIMFILFLIFLVYMLWINWNIDERKQKKKIVNHIKNRYNLSDAWKIDNYYFWQDKYNDFWFILRLDNYVRREEKNFTIIETRDGAIFSTTIPYSKIDRFDFKNRRFVHG